MNYNFYFYILIQEVDGVEIWNTYVVKTWSNKQATEIAWNHAAVLDSEQDNDRGEEWEVHMVAPFDMSRVSQGLPVRVASFNIPVDCGLDRVDIGNL